MDPTTSPIMVAILALLAIPAVTSGVTGILRYLSDRAGINPRIAVYVASVIVTVALVATGAVVLPAFDGDPAAYTLAWLAWLVSNAELARRVYELVKPVVWPEPTPEPPPA